jgi:hypothetical protein
MTMEIFEKLLNSLETVGKKVTDERHWGLSSKQKHSNRTPSIVRIISPQNRLRGAETAS